MNPSLTEQILSADSYADRVALIKRHLDRAENEVPSYLEAAFAAVPPDIAFQLGLTRALILSEIATACADAGRTAAARENAKLTLMAYQEALYRSSDQRPRDEDDVETLLEALLADAGKFRELGLDEPAFCAYRIADRCFAVFEEKAKTREQVGPRDLASACVLEQLGLGEAAEALRARLGPEAASGSQRESLLRLAETAAGPPPTELPRADATDGTSLDTAFRFRSMRAGLAAVQQTRCPECGGALHLDSSTLMVGRGKVHKMYSMRCTAKRCGTAVTLYRDASGFPGMGGIADFGGEIDRNQNERYLESPRPKATWVAPSETTSPTRASHLARALTVVTIAVVYVLAAWNGRLLAARFGVDVDLWRVVLAGLAGAATWFAVAAVFAVPQAILQHRSSEDSGRRKPPPLVGLLALASGIAVAFWLAKWAVILALVLTPLYLWLVNTILLRPLARWRSRGAA